MPNNFKKTNVKLGPLTDIDLLKRVLEEEYVLQFISIKS